MNFQTVEIYQQYHAQSFLARAYYSKIKEKLRGMLSPMCTGEGKTLRDKLNAIGFMTPI